MMGTVLALHRDQRAYGRRMVRVGRHGAQWRVAFFVNGQFHQHMRHLSEAQARGEAVRVIARHGYVLGSDLPPVCDDGTWYDVDGEGASDE